ncbi:uncharacterized protein B0I36DRAFT_82694 [Microdochium trichocladiopsis]|uniref:Uncharacterized protein n=1 Tax=Microdochium trichocladiopsis TaxID=1682393 RepID=A0A9P9BW21_9PEZI|nr:uncharacterized protein B0I36DRAFT_82694 [Microdochium trichocladiopsis]KAH7034636.1 hypothetical protein B0I36DRAFT_82694 [Microdochium trichocladiopsis]
MRVRLACLVQRREFKIATGHSYIQHDSLIHGKARCPKQCLVVHISKLISKYKSFAKPVDENVQCDLFCAKEHHDGFGLSLVQPGNDSGPNMLTSVAIATLQASELRAQERQVSFKLHDAQRHASHRSACEAQWLATSDEVVRFEETASFGPLWYMTELVAVDRLPLDIHVRTSEGGTVSQTRRTQLQLVCHSWWMLREPCTPIRPPRIGTRAPATCRRIRRPRHVLPFVPNFVQVSFARVSWFNAITVAPNGVLCMDYPEQGLVRRS